MHMKRSATPARSRTTIFAQVFATCCRPSSPACSTALRPPNPVLVLQRQRRLVFGEPPLHARAREDADELPVLDHGHALVVVLLEKRERVVEAHRGIDRGIRLLGD